MQEPVTLACGHSGCLSCLKTLREPEHVDHRWCPMCKAEIPCVEFHVTVALKNLIYSLRVVCDEEGCHWLGKLEGAKNHFQECEFINVECKNDGCSFKARRVEVHEHEALCADRKEPCPMCTIPVVERKREEHATLECPSATRECPLQCGEKFIR